MKVVINNCYGGFGLSNAAVLRYAELAGISLRVEPPTEDNPLLMYYYKDRPSEKAVFWERDIPRNDPHLVQVVEELGKEASGSFARLVIVEIPDISFCIQEYDGQEHVAECHRRWYYKP